MCQIHVLLLVYWNRCQCWKHSLSVSEIVVSEQMITPSLRNLIMTFSESEGVSVDNHLRTFMYPSLVSFSLHTAGNWTREVLEILKRQYDMQELRTVKIGSYVALPVSSLLRDAPMLHSLSLGWDAIMDDEAVIGISNGTLGRFLKKLAFSIFCDVGEVLDIVEARKKTVDGLLENWCSWKEEITVLKDITITVSAGQHIIDGYRERVIALKEAGITITFL
ncbi:hypothetical protein AX14_011487 [Amanita brunnescens Koide BX004]|nr:hypothetical protein AX14_011487 [Amanita brunnescens Koide BX004]